MFDIGFTEILLIGVVSLVVIGPEKLPGVIRQLLIHLKNIKSQIATIKSDVTEELDVHDIKQQLSNERDELKNIAGYDELHESLDELNNLKNQSLHPEDFFDENLVSQDTIDIETKELIDQDHGPKFPHPNKHQDTGVEKPTKESTLIGATKNNTHDRN